MDVNKVIEQNLGLIHKLLYKFNLHKDQEAESIAYWALYKAIQTYKDDKSCLLSTYAHCCIYNALGDYVRKLNQKRQLEVLSYNTVAYKEGDNEVTHESLLAAGDKHQPESSLLKQELIGETRKAVTYVLSHMSNKTHKVIVQTWLDSDLLAQTTDIAEIVGVSQSYASQTIAIFKNKVKKRMEEYYNA